MSDQSSVKMATIKGVVVVMGTKRPEAYGCHPYVEQVGEWFHCAVLDDRPITVQEAELLIANEIRIRYLAGKVGPVD